jgi:hypothetical protein
MADVHLEFIWQPKESPEIVIADGLSRVIDVSNSALCYKIFKSICLFKRPAEGRIWGFPTGDAFAGTPDGFHKASR